MPTDGPQSREFLDVNFHTLTLEGVLKCLASTRPDSPYRYVVTPNVDHMVRLLADDDHHGDSAEIRAAYERAALCLCDSRVLGKLAGLCGIDLPVVPGSDLTARLFEDVVRSGEKIMLVGGDPGLVAEMRAMYPLIDIRQHLPPMGLRRNQVAMENAVDNIVACGARFIFLAVGSPQQELLARRIGMRADARGTALCVGAAIALVAGHERRAPLFLRKLGMEWGYRLLQDPLRLWRRYLVDGPKIFGHVWKWRRRRNTRLAR